jgi:hypothetical protein
MRISRFGRSVSSVSGFTALALSIGPASGAIAAAPTPAVIVMSPIGTIAYGDSTVTIHGTLETRVSNASDARPIAGKPVDLALRNGLLPKDLGTGKGGAFKVRLPAGRRYYHVLTTKLPHDYDGVISREIYFSG